MVGGLRKFEETGVCFCVCNTQNSEDGKMCHKRQIHVYSAEAPETNKGAINTLSPQSSEGQEAGLQPLVNSI